MVFLVLAMVAANTVDRVVPSDFETSSTTELSLHLGYGYGEASLALVRPRIRYERPRFSVAVGAPVVLGGAEAAFDAPEAWASWVEQLDLDLGALALRVGPLVDAGRGLSVDRLTSRLGPVDLRSGAELQWRSRRHRLRVLSDGLLDVRVFALDFESRLFEGESTSVRWSATAASDPRAPGRLGPTPVLAADVGMTVEQSFGTAVALCWRAGLGGLFRDRPASLGWGSELALRIGPADRHLRIGGGARWAGDGYIASYFDRLYASERDGFQGVAKADLELASGWIGRASVQLRLDGLGVELGFEEGALPGRARVDATVSLADDDWQLSAVAAQRALADATQLVELEETTYLSLDFSHRIWRSFFAFAAANQRSVEGVSERQAFAGVGFGQSFR